MTPDQVREAMQAIHTLNFVECEQARSKPGEEDTLTIKSARFGSHELGPRERVIVLNVLRGEAEMKLKTLGVSFQ